MGNCVFSLISFDLYPYLTGALISARLE